MLSIESLATPAFIDIIRKKSVSLFYLFGSQASGATSPLSEEDCVVLNTGDPAVRFNVLAGEPLYMESDEERIDFEVKTRREYFDTQRIRDIRTRALIERQLRTG